MRSIHLVGPLLGALAIVAGCKRDPGTATPAAIDAGDPVRARIAAAVAKLGPSYVAPTRLKNDDGTPKHTNLLIFEASTFLRRHAHDAVDWRPFDDEAFAVSKRTAKPVLLVVGDAFCHLCRVQQEESFEDEALADQINALFVPVLVDRIERPDVDAVYGAAADALGATGSWPRMIGLTQDKTPYFAASFLPPRAGVRGATEGLAELLPKVAERYEKELDIVLSEGDRMAVKVRSMLATPAPGAAAGVPTLIAAMQRLEQLYDPSNGSLQGSPSQPLAIPHRLCLRVAQRSGDRKIWAMAIESLQQMSHGAIHDQVGGGFHHTAFGARWGAPMFDKTLADQAQLAVAYLEASQATDDAALRWVARATFDAMVRDFKLDSGLFAAGLDGDGRSATGALETGRFYTWTPSEISAALGADDAIVPLAAYDVTLTGNLDDGRTALATLQSPAEIGASLKLDPRKVVEAMTAARAKLFDARRARPAPMRDATAIVGWNALAVSALARGAIVLGEDAWAKVAVAAGTRLVADLRAGKSLAHAHYGDETRGAAMLDDVALLGLAALDLFELTGDVAWLADARALAKQIDERFGDPAKGTHFSAQSTPTLIARPRPLRDGPTPSGDSATAMLALRLAELTGDGAARTLAETTIEGDALGLAQDPLSRTEMLLAVERTTDAPKRVVVALPAGADRALARPLLAPLSRTFAPSTALIVATDDALAGPIGAEVAWAKDKQSTQSKPTAFVCARDACKSTHDAGELAKWLGAATPYPKAPSK